MMGLALYLVAAAIGAGAAHALRLPAIPFYLMAGYFLARLPVAPEREFSAVLLELGAALLVFSAGTELSPRRFSHQTASVLWVALTQFFVVGAAVAIAAQAMGFDLAASVYMGFAVSASSTFVVIRHLRKRQQMFQPFGRLVTGVLLAQDVVLVGILVVFGGVNVGLEKMPLQIGGFVLLCGLAALGHWVVWPRVAGGFLKDDETLLLVALATLFVFAASAGMLGLPLVAGAFLAGFTLAAFPVNDLLRGLLGSLNEFFQALFFLSLGALVVLDGWEIVAAAAGLAVVVFLVTPPVVALVAEWRGQSARTGIESGLLLAQSSELGIVLALTGMAAGHLEAAAFSAVALVAAITMTVTPLVATDEVTWKLLHWHPSRKRHLPVMSKTGHVVLLGFGSAGMWAVKPLRQAGYDVVVVDEDPAVIEALNRMKITCVRADGSDSRTLHMVNAAQARLVIAALPRFEDVLKVVRQLAGVEVVARVQEEAEASAIREAGGVPILNAEAAVEEFLKWFENFCCRSSPSSQEKTQPTAS